MFIKTDWTVQTCNLDLNVSFIAKAAVDIVQLNGQLLVEFILILKLASPIF